MDALTTRIGNFAASLSFNDLSPQLINAVKQRVIDTLACNLGAVTCEPVKIAMRLCEGAVPKRWQGRILCYPERTTAESAAFVSSLMSRYLDYNDSGPGSHPSDSIGGLMAIAEAAKADGKRLLTSILVTYETIFRFAIGTQFRKKGWDQGFCTAVGTAAGAGHLLNLPAEKIMQGVAIAAVSNVPLRASRAGQLSYWKAAATPYAVKNAVQAAVLAAEGMTGPEQPFEGRFGLWEQLTGPFEIAPFMTEGGESLFERWSRLKYWPVEYNAQIVVWAAREIRAKLAVDQIESITVETYYQAWHEIASEEAKWNPQTRETADHSMPYIFARTLLDGAITVSSFDEAAYTDPKVRPLMQRIKVQVDEQMSPMFPARVPIRVKVVAKSGEQFTIDMINPKGHNENPMNNDDVDAKFKSTAEPVLGPQQTAKALQTWWKIDSEPTLTRAFDLLIPEK